MQRAFRRAQQFNRAAIAAALILATTSLAAAHDTWIQVSSPVVRVGDWVGLSLMLGNHGNKHRDFKLASKLAASDKTLLVLAPDGTRIDISSTLFDSGMTEEEGFWQGRFTPAEAGYYTATSLFDKVMSYGPVRDVKCAKAYFLAEGSKRMTRVTEKPVGAPFEMLAVTDPCRLKQGEELKVQVLMSGRPMANVTVGFIPRGAAAEGDFDPRYQARTDANGIAAMRLTEANDYLIAAHHEDTTAKGEGYDSIHYSATICLRTSSRLRK